MSRKNKKRKKGIVPLLITLIIICICIAGVSGYICLEKLFNDNRTESEYKSVEEQVVSFNDETDNTDDENSDISKEKPPISVDFEKLKSINSDVCAWIYIPCIDVSYPVMHCDSNEKYLHMDMYGNYAYAGCLFMETSCNPDFTGSSTLIYGHNMKNGSMFGKLGTIPYNDAAHDNNIVWIVTENKTYKYEMFSTFTTTTSSTVYKIFSKGSEEFINWCNEMNSNSYIDFGKHTFTSDSKILTLSSCTYATGDKRTVVMNVLVDTFDNTVDKDNEITIE